MKKVIEREMEKNERNSKELVNPTVMHTMFRGIHLPLGQLSNGAC